MIYTKEQNKELCERYPFLIPRSVWTGEIDPDFEYDYIEGIGEIPVGWEKLFLQMCEDIRQPLIDANYLDEFRFSQIKEKYGEMRCYHFGAPEIVVDIIMNYEHVSRLICAGCGRPATVETRGYVLPMCNECIVSMPKRDCCDIHQDLVRHSVEYRKNERIEVEHDCSDIWNRLYMNND